MTEHRNYTSRLQSLLDRWGDGDDSAIDEIIVHSQERLRLMARCRLVNEPVVRRYNQTDDVLQNSLMRLRRSLKDVKPDSQRAFNKLAATLIRRELIDLARSLKGPQGYGGNHRTKHVRFNADGSRRPVYERADPATDVFGQLEMAEFHEQVDSLPADEREVFELIFYQDMTQAEVAALLKVSERTIKRRWRQARLSLQRAFESKNK